MFFSYEIIRYKVFYENKKKIEMHDENVHAPPASKTIHRLDVGLNTFHTLGLLANTKRVAIVTAVDICIMGNISEI